MQGLAILEQILKLISVFLIVGGALWLIFGGVTFASSLNDQNGQQKLNGIMQMAGGALIIALGGAMIGWVVPLTKMGI